MRLPLMAALWIFCQMAAFAAAPLIFAETMAMTAPLGGCDCPGATPGQACPMHDAPATDDTSNCHMRGACATADVALLRLAGGVGLPSRPTVENIELGAASFASRDLNPIARPDVPDAPPPRA
jgi:hypothetical protein